MGISKKMSNFVSKSEKLRHAVVAQLVEHQLPKLRVASSSLVYRSLEIKRLAKAKSLDFSFIARGSNIFEMFQLPNFDFATGILTHIRMTPLF